MGFNDYAICWITFIENEGLHITASHVSFAIFYGEIWISALIIIFLSFKISRDLKNHEYKKSVQKLRSKLKLYPLVIIVCWIFPFVNNIAMKTGYKSEALLFLQLLSVSLQGTLNFFVYGLSLIARNFKKSEIKNEEVKINMNINNM